MDETDGHTAPVVRVSARAKINLALHVTGRRADGYHLLDSVVAFARPVGDGPRTADTLEVHFGPAETPHLTLAGPFAGDVPADADNLVVRAARVAGGIRAVRLDKHLPVASGIGGGSADAAAVLTAAAAHRGIDRATFAAPALALGADVPVCLHGGSCRMAGIGERLTPLRLPELPILLVNPGVAVATGAVFGALARRDNPPLPDAPPPDDAAGLLDWLRSTRNDLEAAAVTVAPTIATATTALRETGAVLARMSGSGATVFGLYTSPAARDAAATALRRTSPQWWVACGGVGGD
ncbi:4-(cytidine 5'-diphospho)-2-C-methyl-D-erythritol kinase [Acuticoccus mangrovi]|uniref:4-diphosphocytidyl-2-C-methyl-D-erythritol kinase n=1 Tax=Acuticoccus mangrovi TaxID=2796142 RepID=A0A934IUI0_9HYPH|nr:4-(cytidine 5'-diphospho)-2-C-methyl-D-erythritol kinase [Acuticoccus mangrovi]MBJ3778275.1 4-(cytidine 5'-diphospho)-2-C-methyl-D-erythritol kinase [Acuticoccus mangrovi]